MKKKKKRRKELLGIRCHFYGVPLVEVEYAICIMCDRIHIEEGHSLPACPSLLVREYVPRLTGLKD